MTETKQIQHVCKKSVSTLKLAFLLSVFFVSLFFGRLVLAELPKRDLVIQLRQVAEGAGTSYSVSTDSDQAQPAEQSVQVRNGEKASLHMGSSVPMQWVQSVTAQTATLAASGSLASRRGGDVSNAITWMESGQTVNITARWPGRHQLVSLDIEFQSASIEPRVGAELPSQTRSRISTSVNMTLGQWVTIASSGSTAQRGVYGSEGSGSTRRMLQIRVLAER